MRAHYNGHNTELETYRVAVISFRDEEEELADKVYSIMKAKGWRPDYFDNAIMIGVEDRYQFDNDFMADYKEAKKQAKNAK